MHSPGGLEAPCGNFLGSPKSYSHWNGPMLSYATVVIVGVSLVVRILEDACPSVH